MDVDRVTSLESEIGRLRAIVDRQEAELARALAGPTTTRRNLLKGAGAVAAAGAVGAAAATAAASPARAAVPTTRAPGVDVPRAADVIALFLTANGVPIPGDSQQIFTEDAIDVLSFVSTGASVLNRNGVATGRRQYEPVRIRKRIDVASVLITKAFVQQEAIEAEFWFIRAGDRPVRYYTVQLDQARIIAVEQVSPDGLSNQGAAPTGTPPFEDVSIAFNRITWRWEDGGIEFVDQFGTGQ